VRKTHGRLKLNRYPVGTERARANGAMVCVKIVIARWQTIFPQHSSKSEADKSVNKERARWTKKIRDQDDVFGLIEGEPDRVSK